jgi:hypothetical protein
MAINRTYISTAEKIETAILQHLRYEGDFKGCALVMHGLALEAPEKLPCAIIHCDNVSTHEGFQLAARSFRANVNITLYGDSEQMTRAKFQKYAREIERKVFVNTDLQFNPPESGRDPRKIRGMYLHEYADWNTESTRDGTTWKHTSNLGLIFQSL